VTTGSTTVGPHPFRPLRRFWNRSRCLHCIAHEGFHPTRGWLPARAYGDRSVPRAGSFKGFDSVIAWWRSLG
jgi:hypothetical protein